MIDLAIQYQSQPGKMETKEYSTIMDFTDDMEAGIQCVPEGCSNIKAVFFENPLNAKKFQSVQMLYAHCRAIMA